MRVLVDENLPRKIIAHLAGHECRTVAECGWSGVSNGALLELAGPQFDVLLTLDKNLPFQQNLSGRTISVIVVRARSNRIRDLLVVLPECLEALARVNPGEVIRVGRAPLTPARTP